MLLDGLGLRKDSSHIVLSGRQSKRLLFVRATKRDVQTSSPIKVTYEGRAISTLHGEDSAGSQSRMEVMTSFIVNLSWVTRTHGSVVAVLQIGMA
jgi:hypothetical protein